MTQRTVTRSPLARMDPQADLRGVIEATNANFAELGTTQSTDVELLTVRPLLAMDRERAGREVLRVTRANVTAVAAAAEVDAPLLPESALVDPFSRVLPALDAAFDVLYAVEPSEEEGGGAPEWLPEGALEYSDFANAHYYADGAETTLGAMWVQYAPHSTFSASDVVASAGLYAEEAARGPVATGANLTGAMAGRTFVVNFTIANEFATAQMRHLDGADASQRNAAFEGPDGNTVIQNESDGAFFDPLTVGPHRAAITLSQTRIAMSIDGGASQFLTSEVPCTKFALRVADGGVIASLAAFAAAEDAALPALSTL